MKRFVFIVIAFALALALAHSSTVDPVKDPVENPILDEPSTEMNTECYQPRETGLCLAAFMRYAFNPEKQICEKFVYGGCGGNSNNFETREECELNCIKKTIDTQEKKSHINANILKALAG